MIFVAELSFYLALLIDTFPNTYMLDILCCTPVEGVSSTLFYPVLCSERLTWGYRSFAFRPLFGLGCPG